jgi:outer membrane protein assembly factor BamA
VDGPVKAAAPALAAALLCASLPAPAAGRDVPAGAPAPALAGRDEHAPRVRSIAMRLPPGEAEAELRALVALREGDPLTSRELRRTVQRIWQTGRFRNVLVRAADVAAPPGESGAWVDLVVEAQPVRILSSVAVKADGPSVLDDGRVRAVARLAPGEPFDDADLDAAAERVRAALARRGYRDARVEARARGTVAELTVRAGEPVRVSEVRLAGDPGPLAASSPVRARPGAVLEDDLLDADVRALRAALYRAGHRRGRVGAPAVHVSSAGAVVEYPVEAGPRVSLRFAGNLAFPSRLLEAQLGIEADAPLDASALDAAAERLRLFYRGRGFAEARAEVEEVRSRGVLVALFHVAEGRRYRLGEIRLDGLSPDSAASARARLLQTLAAADAPDDGGAAERARELQLSVPGAPAAPALPAPLRPGEFFEEGLFDRAAEGLVDDARAVGWLEAVYLGSSLSLDARSGIASVTLRFREGARTTVEAISFEGNRQVPLADLAREARLAPQEPLVWARVEETRAALQRLYLSRGHLFARVEAREGLDRASHTASIRFVVDEGPQVRIGRLLLSGNLRTREGVVKEALAVHEGDVFDPDAVARSQAALLRLGVFRSVALRVQEPDAPHETKDLGVELAERPWATLTQGLGYSLAGGPRATAEFGMPNLLGRALELTARAKVNYPINTPWTSSYRPELEGKPPKDIIEGRAEVGLRSPRFGLPLPSSVRANVLGEILHRRAYDLDRVAAIAGVDVDLASRLTASLQYELEVDDITKSEAAGALTQADLERLRFDEGVTTLNVIRPSVTIDHRDNPLHPHSGWYGSAALEWAKSLGGPDSPVGFLPGSDIPVHFLKPSIVLSGYVPAGRTSVIALSARAGRVFPLSDDSQTIIPRRFFLGGSATMRGFAEEELVPQDVRGDLSAEARHCATSPSGVGCTERGARIVDGERPVSEGGEAFVLAKAELRVPLRGSVEGGLFFDVGNVWLDPRKYRLVDLRPNAGAGLRFVTPIGPAAIDVGFNLDPDRDINERLYAVHFAIGLF